MTPASLEHEVEFVRSFDGTLLAARKVREGSKVPVLITNAVGANLAAWRRVLIEINHDRPIIAWDMRGMHESNPPESDRIDPGAHAEDAVAVLDHFGIDKFSIASWSNGARIALEISHRYPESVASMTIVSGGYGHSLARLLKLEPASLLPSIAGVAKHFASWIEGPLKALTTRPEFAGIVRQSGQIAATADTKSMVDFLRGIAACDTKAFLATYEAVAGDPAPDLLDDVIAPTLIVAGERDQFINRSTSEEMARRIPAAQLLFYERATHYLPIEYPARLAEDLEFFWSENRL
jgi:pimeloyl-ACP methyl ester carboxylesterase